MRILHPTFLALLLVSALTYLTRADEPATFNVSAVVGNLSGNYNGPGGCGAEPLTYTVNFGGQTVSNYFPGCCGIYFGFTTPLMPTTVAPEQDYHATLQLTTSGGFCCTPQLEVYGLPPCVSSYSYNPCSVGASSMDLTVQIRHNESALPVLQWDIKDATGEEQSQSTANGVYQLTADGQSQAIASVVNVSGPLALQFVGTNLGCTLEGMTLTSGTNEGNIQIRASLDGGDACLVRDFYFHLKKSCSSCPAGDDACDLSVQDNSIDIRFGLGVSRKDAGSSYLQVKAASPNPELGTPASLQCNFIRPELQVMTNAMGWIQQVRSLDRILDVQVNSSTSYSVNFYSLTNVLLMPSGLYSFGNSPYKTVTIELVNGDTNHIRVSNSSDPAPADYLWQGAGWSLVTGNGLRHEAKLVTQNGISRTETRTIQNAQSVVGYESSETWQTFSFGDRLIQRVIGSGAAARTESYGYDDNGRLQQVVHEDGSWDIYAYDTMGRQVGHYQPFLNSSPTTNLSQCRFTYSSYDNRVTVGSGDDGNLSLYTPRLVIEYVLGKEVSRRYAVIKTGERHEIQCVTPGAPWNAPDNLVTVSYFHTGVVHLNEPSRIVRPDGTVQIFTYDKAPLPGASGLLLQRTRIETGMPNATGTSVTNGTLDEIWLDNFQRAALHRITDIASQLVTDQQTYSYDARGHLISTMYLDGTAVQQTFDCCKLISRVDRDGTMTGYGYDALNRVLITTVNGITISNIYNANGNVIGTVRYGTDGTAIIQNASTFDDAGQLTSSTDALDNQTTYTNYFEGNGQLVRVTTYPDLSTRIETYATDGSLLKVTGSAVHPARYDYGVELEAGLQRLFKKEIKLNAAGQDTLEWVKTYTDMMGRPYKTVYASSVGQPASQYFYNSRGQVFKQVDPDGVTTIFTYNAKGEQEFTVGDLHGDGQLHLDGTNRVTRTVSDVLTDPVLGAAVRQTLFYVWPTDNADAPRLVSSSAVSLDGLRSWNVIWNNGIGLTNSSWTAFDPGNGFRISASIAPDNSYTITTNQYGRILSVTAYDGTGAQLGQTLYGYDAHGRQNAAIDARSGMTTYTFNDCDQLVSVFSPVPAPGQSGQLTTSYFDSMGRVWKTVLSDNTSVTNDYYSTGELKWTCGSRTYPVAYTYDSQGRMKTMTTWTNFTTGSGAVTTTWNYDPYRGFLVSKVYADGTGPVYSYTEAGRLKSRTWARGVLTLYSYNTAGDLNRVDYSDSTPGLVFSYDRLERKTAIGQGTTVTARSYNDAGQLLSESYSGGPLDGISILNGYDSLLRRTNLVAQQSDIPLTQQGFGYDAASRLQIVSEGVHSATYSYLTNSALVSEILFQQNGVTRLMTTKQYDNLGRLTEISSAPSGSNAVSFKYQYNDANQRIAATNADQSKWVYQYDNLGQIISGKRYGQDGTPIAGQQFEYRFDDIGNRNSTKAGGDSGGANLRSANYSANALNQYTSREVPGYVTMLGSANSNATVSLWGNNDSWAQTSRRAEYFAGDLPVNNTTGAVWLTLTNLAVLNDGTNADIVTNIVGSVFLARTPEVFTYDADGNLTSDGRWTYTWDAENRLINMTSLTTAPAGSKLKLDFAYDYQARRTQKVVSTWNGSAYVAQGTNRFAYDGWNLLVEFRPETLDTYLWGLDLSGSLQGAGGVGGLLAFSESRDGQTQDLNFVCYDGNGNVSALVDANDGTVSGQYEYAPFGETLRDTGSNSPLQFSTKLRDQETDLLYFGHRYFNPRSATWISRDPLAESRGSPNLYEFTRNAPGSFIDPDGRKLFLLQDKDGNWNFSYFPPWWGEQYNPFAFLPGEPGQGYVTLDKFNFLNHPVLYDEFDYMFLEQISGSTDLYPFGNLRPQEIDEAYQRGYIDLGEYPVLGTMDSHGYVVSLTGQQALTDLLLALVAASYGEAFASLMQESQIQCICQKSVRALNPILQTQKELSFLVNKQGEVVDRWLNASSARWARFYRSLQNSDPNCAAVVRGRLLDFRMKSKFRNLFGDMAGVRIDQTIPGSGNDLRPDLYFPNLGGQKVIFDVGGPTKVQGIKKYFGMADHLIPLVPKQWVR